MVNEARRDQVRHPEFLPVGHDTSTKGHDVRKIHVQSLSRPSEDDDSEGTAYGPMKALSLAEEFTAIAHPQSRSAIEPVRSTRVQGRTGSSGKGCALRFGLANSPRWGGAEITVRHSRHKLAFPRDREASAAGIPGTAAIMAGGIVKAHPQSADPAVQSSRNRRPPRLAVETASFSGEKVYALGRRRGVTDSWRQSN